MFFLRIYFPDDQAIKLILSRLHQQTGLIITPTNSSLLFFPSLGMKFDSIRLKNPNSRLSINLGDTSLKLPWFSILTLSPVLDINSNSFQGSFNIRVSDLPLGFKEPPDEVDLDILGEKIQIHDIVSDLIPIDISGLVDISLTGILNLMNLPYSDLNIDTDLSKITTKEGNIMGFSIPGIRMNKGKFTASFSKSELVISKLMLGGPKSDLDLTVKGKITLKFNNPYEFTVKLKLKKKLEKEFGQFLAFIANTKRPDGFYNFKVAGNTKMPIPQITPIR